MNGKIQPQAAWPLLRAGQAVAVDVREASEYAAGHIPAAVLLPLGDIERRAESVLPAKQAQLFVYCRSGHRAAAAVRKLRALGYENVCNLGGILSWPYEVES